MKKILVTGATGLIGSQILKPLHEAGYNVYSLSRNKVHSNIATSIKCDIFNESEIEQRFSEIKPDYLLYLAWFTGQNYLHSNINFDYITASMNMLKYLKKYGGVRAILVGTCFEYDLSDARLLKEMHKLAPSTVYAKCKCALNYIAKLYCEANGISYSWGRIFYVYGKNENEKRLIGSLLKHLQEGKEITINSGSLIRDYMYTRDISNALITILESGLEGNINICTGEGIKIADLILKFARKLGKEYLVKFVDNVGEQPPIIVGDNSKLLSLGFKKQFSLDEAVDDILKDN